MIRIVICLLSLWLCTDACAADLSSQRAAFKRALETAERGPLSEYRAAALPFAKHPLAPYLEYATLRRQLSTTGAEPVRTFLARNAGLPIATTLRDAWLGTLVQRRDWATFRQFYVEREDATLRCASLQSRLVAGGDATLMDEAQAMWLSADSVPALCDPVFAALKLAGRITPALVWQRIDLAAEAGNVALIRFLAKSLPAAEATRALSYANYLAAPTQAPSATWPADARSRRIAVLGMTRLAKNNPGVAEGLLAALTPRLKLAERERGEVLYQVALWTAASYLPESARRFAAVPAASYDERLHEWRAREALARNDRPAARKAIAAMGEAQRADPRWRYLDARLRELDGDTTARADYAAIAREPNYFGFLAADRIDAPYALCPLDPPNDAALHKRVDALPALVRARELHAIGREAWARREWDVLMPTLSVDERRVAVALADDAGWFDRAVFTLNSGDDLRLYALRFPLPHEKHVRAESKTNGLDPAWVAALIRAESAWIADARSHANALGLMQLLPGTAKMEAKKLGLGWSGDQLLYQPLTNITLGTTHLASMLRKHGGRPYLATAAYNAGAGAVARWLSQRTPTDVDLWIETIPYRETREYVARILAFSVIYDWRFDGDAVPVSRRMVGDPGAQRVTRRKFVCPAAAPAVASLPAAASTP
ncbi:lytic transglycosylase domain-containing protein [Chiayiivirga flava]|uniref:Soluble lytic murein transglycosylase n=1 Tax=Chiayiivirga flava TaxID=659595 RepID=A0A7W8G076_9GAMM|nr:lytic transglycosylase domain-containing protein [Chiayiivirga flava]MBB5208896.1 soluble lytic murein transglycosylase [Chiayiivirga flava]